MLFLRITCSKLISYDNKNNVKRLLNKLVININNNNNIILYIIGYSM